MRRESESAVSEGVQPSSAAGSVLVERLPHAYPFVVIDRVLAIEPGQWAVTMKNVGADDPFLDPKTGWTRVLLVEVMAQTAGIAAAGLGSGQPQGVLAAVNRFRCGRSVQPGDRLLVTARVVRRFGSLVKTRSLVRTGSARCAAAELVLSLAPRPHG